MNPDGTGDTDLGIRAINWLLTDQYIYYVTYDEKSMGKNAVSGYGGSEIVISGSKLHRMKHDGSEDTVVFDFSSPEEGMRLLWWTIAGNYLYGTYTTYFDADEDGKVSDNERYQSCGTSEGDTISLIRIDLTSGKASYIFDD